MQFRLIRIINDQKQIIFVVYPKGYDFGRGFSTLGLAFDYIKAVLNSNI